MSTLRVLTGVFSWVKEDPLPLISLRSLVLQIPERFPNEPSFASYLGMYTDTLVTKNRSARSYALRNNKHSNTLALSQCY